MAYFRYFPKIAYDVRGVENQEQFDLVTNLLARVLVKCHGWADPDGSAHEALVAVCEFEKHIIIDSEKPEILAHQFYGDPELHWLILYANGANMLNPYYDWPMTSYDLNQFIAKKYDDINAVHHYEDADGYEVDSTAAGATSVTNFIYEETLNDAKRNLTVIRSEYVSNVVNEFKKLLK